MSTSNGATPRTIRPADIVGAFAALPRRMGGNLGRWIGTLASPPKVQLRAWPASAPIVIALVVAAIVASMFLLDARASDWALHLPHWLTRFADQITDFGLSGWFLYPLALFLLFLAAVTRSWLPAATQETLALLVARAGFLFMAIALPGLFVTIVKRLIGRARALCRPARQSVPLHAVRLAFRLCQHAVRSCRPPWRRRRLPSAPSGRAHAAVDVALRAVIMAQPRRDLRASSE